MNIDTSTLSLMADIFIFLAATGASFFVCMLFLNRWLDRELREQDAEMEEMIAELEAEWFDEEAGVWRAPDYARPTEA